MEIYKNGNLQKLIILEGFRQNGHYHRNQRIFLRIKSCVKSDFLYLFEQYMYYAYIKQKRTYIYIYII